MNISRIIHNKRDIETEPLSRDILVHMAMHYKCEECGRVFKFWLEKGLEDRKQDEINPESHKPVPFAIQCLCGGTAKHFAWNQDINLTDYRLLGENENYFENKEDEDCGVSHFRKIDARIDVQTTHEESELSEILDIFEKSNGKELIEPYYESEDDDDNPYGLAHISTTTLKAELRRRKQSWKRRNKE